LDRQYWDSKAVNYNDEIFSSIHSDMGGKIRKIIRKYGSRKKTACDFGCGIGLYLPELSLRFKTVHAFDLSPELIKRAKERMKNTGNITYRPVDLSCRSLRLPKADFGALTNVLIMENSYVRKAILKNVFKSLNPGALLFAVVPSLESVLYVNSRLFEWNIRDGIKQDEAVDKGLRSAHAGKGSVSNGLINIDNITTKHYLKEELELFFKGAGFKIINMDKIEYSWKTEFESPPKWMRAPYPWDWMAVCEKPANGKGSG